MSPGDIQFVDPIRATMGVLCPQQHTANGSRLLTGSDTGLPQDSSAAFAWETPPAQVHFIYTTWPILWVRPLHWWPQNFRKIQPARFERWRNKRGKTSSHLHRQLKGLFFFFLPHCREDCWVVSFPFRSHIPTFGICSYFFSSARCSLLAPWFTSLLDFHLFHVPFPVLMVNRACTVN